MGFDRSFDRVKKITGWKTQNDLADWLGIKQSSVSGAKKNNRFLLEWAYKIAKFYNSNTDWIMDGDEKDFSVAEGISEARFPGAGEFALVPRYNVHASAGHGSEIHSEQIVDHLAFKCTWLKDMDLQADYLALITAKGDSMVPTIKDGSLLLVDTRKNESIREGIYILRMDGVLLAKRLQRLLDGGILVQSDNPAYKELKAEKDQLQLLDIIGRVVWAGGTI